jgi:hypothetical protein
VRRGRDVAFLAGELADEDGAVVAVATATAQIRAGMLAGRREPRGGPEAEALPPPSAPASR